MDKNIFNLNGKVALITGGAGLLAVEFAIVLSEYGAKVILADLDIDECIARLKVYIIKIYTLLN